MEGIGRFNYADGSWYQGELHDGCIHGQGIFTYANRDKYEGEWKHHSKHGQGTLTFANGDVQEGHWRSDKMDGFGTYKFRDGDSYEGLWKEGMKHGEGTHISVAKDEKYTGTFYRDQMHGLGMLRFGNGDFYEGEFRENKITGHGLMKYENGDVYEGYFVAGLPEGEGTYYYSDGECFELSDWCRMSVLFRSHCISSNLFLYIMRISGDQYVGAWKRGHRHGLGTFYLSDGLTTLDGEWLHDVRVGPRPKPEAKPKRDDGSDEEDDKSQPSHGREGTAAGTDVSAKPKKKGYVPPTEAELRVKMEVADSIEEQIDLLRQIMRMNPKNKISIPPLLDEAEKKKRKAVAKEMAAQERNR